MYMHYLEACRQETEEEGRVCRSPRDGPQLVSPPHLSFPSGCFSLCPLCTHYIRVPAFMWTWSSDIEVVHYGNVPHGSKVFPFSALTPYVTLM